MANNKLKAVEATASNYPETQGFFNIVEKDLDGLKTQVGGIPLSFELYPASHDQAGEIMEDSRLNDFINYARENPFASFQLEGNFHDLKAPKGYKAARRA